MTATTGTAFTTTVRVIDWVHNDATDRRTNAQPTFATGFAE
jgi:hypothetical protein